MNEGSLADRRESEPGEGAGTRPKGSRRRREGKRPDCGAELPGRRRCGPQEADPRGGTGAPPAARSGLGAPPGPGGGWGGGGRGAGVLETARGSGRVKTETGGGGDRAAGRGPRGRGTEQTARPTAGSQAPPRLLRPPEAETGRAEVPGGLTLSFHLLGPPHTPRRCLRPQSGPGEPSCWVGRGEPGGLALGAGRAAARSRSRVGRRARSAAQSGRARAARLPPGGHGWHCRRRSPRPRGGPH